LPLIGHSLGGVIACAIARAHPEAVRGIITLGAPLHSVAASPHPLVALYSRSDRVVRYPRALAPNGGRNIEITGSHGGMAFNAQVYRHLGALLAES
jgi:pimeloyl-ACP methyl ester carboxylesterase